MSTALPVDRIDHFRVIVARRFGLQFEDGRRPWLGDLVQRRAQARELTPAAYLSWLEGGAVEELTALKQELTVPETYFLRHTEHLRALKEKILPDLLRAQPGARRLRILSAGCASGEEAYSIAMTLSGWSHPQLGGVSIHAVDLNPANIEKARRGRYTAWSLRDTPDASRERWFRYVDGGFELDESLRAAVVFEERNLSLEDFEFWRPNAFDVVFCRNVLMYFAPDAARDAIARITRSLVPGGTLFLGHAETLRGLSNDYDLRHTHDTFYYQRKTRVSAATGTAHPTPWPMLAPGLPSERADEQDGLGGDWAGGDRAEGDWVHQIGQSAHRIRALTQSAKGGGSAPADASVAGAPQLLAQALNLMRHERYAEALAQVHALSASAAAVPDAMLLRAALLVQCGQLAPAEEACHRLLAADGLNAGAQYVLGLCREAAGDLAAAVDRHQAAAYLDPTFSLPRLHLGLLARRAGERDTMRRELTQALGLLKLEEPSRLLLFGGGFDRGALLALCQAELRTIGVSS